MTDLDHILSIGDKDKRYRALRRLAGALRIPARTLTRNGKEISEEHLVVLIYDASKQRMKKSKSNLVFMMIWTLIGVLGFVFLARVPKTIVKMYRELEAKAQKDQKALKGINDEGKDVLDENNQPVLYRPMQGVYQEFYGDGSLHFEYEYDNGEIVKKREFDKKGKLVAEVHFDENGNATYVEQ